MKTLVVYQSNTGTTKRMAEEISQVLGEQNAEVKIGSIEEITKFDIENADKLYIGCPTNGLFIFGQGPTKSWKRFVNQLPVINNKETMLFTTYKFSTGKVFKKMRRELRYNGFKILNVALKSKTGGLSKIHQELLKQSLN